MFVVETGQLTSPRYIINFPTKRHWRGKIRMEDIEAGLRDLQRVIREKNIRSIAIPPLGSGLGGGTLVTRPTSNSRSCPEPSVMPIAFSGSIRPPILGSTELPTLSLALKRPLDLNCCPLCIGSSLPSILGQSTSSRGTFTLGTTGRSNSHHARLASHSRPCRAKDGSQTPDMFS